MFRSATKMARSNGRSKHVDCGEWTQDENWSFALSRSIASECAGGLGLAASINAGPDHALTQAQHGSAPDIAGQGVANPTSLVLSAAMLLRHIGHEGPATAIEAAVGGCADLGGTARTETFTATIIRRIGNARV